MKVKAIKLGYYDHKRIREGQTFELKPLKDVKGNIISAEKQFSENWMLSLDAKKPTVQAKAKTDKAA